MWKKEFLTRLFAERTERARWTCVHVPHNGGKDRDVMGVRVLAGYLNGGAKKGRLAAASLYDSVTMSAFGPVIALGDTATIEEIAEFGEEFLEYVEVVTGADARTVLNSELHDLLVQFLKKHEEEENEDMKGGAA
jgi:hypothetical protein